MNILQPSSSGPCLSDPKCAVDHAAVICDRVEYKWLPKLLREEVPSRIEFNVIGSDLKIVYMS